MGSACVTALAESGFEVTGIGRLASAARGADPRASWVFRDIPSVTPEEWQTLLAGVSVVVNAAGALQDGARDDLEAIHVHTLSALTRAAADLPLRIIQISAAGVSPTASTRFFRTKAEGDAILAREGRDWVILRPALVLAPEAYGGTALLRAAASLPGLLPEVLPEARIQTVHIGDLAAAVVAAAKGEVPHATVADLCEAESQNLPELSLALRRWLGLPEPRFRPRLPRWLLQASSRIADALGHLGWRSPLRSTALRALADGITGDPATWTNAGGAPCRPLSATLASMPATRADRLAARAFLALPLAIATLAVFWMLSGLVTLAAPQAADHVLTSRGMSEPLAQTLVRGGALADILLGLMILWRPGARLAALGMAGLSATYLALSLFTAPDLWADPLGPMLKVLPGLVLALWVWLFLEDR
ncbi:MAG: SDR family oxidoreductase [Tabrizicola sp.]|nr:SDR family oxidoreductase [Tabrizicola sp.]